MDAVYLDEGYCYRFLSVVARVAWDSGCYQEWSVDYNGFRVVFDLTCYFDKNPNVFTVRIEHGKSVFQTKFPNAMKDDPVFSVIFDRICLEKWEV
mgnify:CR=1 FL=1